MTKGRMLYLSDEQLLMVHNLALECLSLYDPEKDKDKESVHFMNELHQICYKTSGF